MKMAVDRVEHKCTRDRNRLTQDPVRAASRIDVLDPLIIARGGIINRLNLEGSDAAVKCIVRVLKLPVRSATHNRNLTRGDDIAQVRGIRGRRCPRLRCKINTPGTTSTEHHRSCGRRERVSRSGRRNGVAAGWQVRECVISIVIRDRVSARRSAKNGSGAP